jgi:hypothetical protein
MELFHRWESFYLIVGACAGALIGLQFVVITLAADTQIRAGHHTHGGLSTPVIVHFCVALLLSALVCAPWPTVGAVALCLGLTAIGGIAYIGSVWRRLVLQTDYPLVAEDWLFRVALPICAYLILMVSSYAMTSHLSEALFGVAGVSLLLLFNGIHDAWDSILYLVQKKADAEIESERKVASR